MKVEGRTAVITGASTGMGRALAHKLVQLGCSVALCDINMVALEDTAKKAMEIKKNEGVKVTTHEVDVSDNNAVKRFAQEVFQEHNQKVHLLFANAGLSGVGELIHQGISDEEIARKEKSWEKCFNVDYFGVLYCVRAFLPNIIQQDEGYVIITSSINGFWTWPCHGSYTAAKFAVRGLAESLLCETYIKAPHVHVACVHPGWIHTDIVKNSYEGMKDAVKVSEKEMHDANDRFKGVKGPRAGLSAEEAADWILHGVKNNYTRILVGYDAYCFDFSKRLLEHRTYNLFWRMGQEGLNSFGQLSDEAKSSVQDHFQNLSLFGWIRYAISARYNILFVLLPTAVLRSKRLQLLLGLVPTYKLYKSYPWFGQFMLYFLLFRALQGSKL